MASIPALERKESEWGLQSRTEALRDAATEMHCYSRDACKPGEHGVDVQALKTALEQARSDEVLLEGLVPEEESDEPEPPPKGQDDPAPGWFRKCEPRKSSDKVDVYYYPLTGCSCGRGRTSDDTSRASLTWPKSATACSIRKSTSASPRSPSPRRLSFLRPRCREVADACEALRDAEAKFEEIARRRAKVRDIRARALPRLEPLSYDKKQKRLLGVPSARHFTTSAVPKPRPRRRSESGSRTGRVRRRRRPSTRARVRAAIGGLARRAGCPRARLKDGEADHLPVFGLDESAPTGPSPFGSAGCRRACGARA